MRFNTSLVITVLVVFGGIWGVIKQTNWPRSWIFGLEFLLFPVLFLVYRDAGAFTVVPGIKFKEAFSLDLFSLFQVNVFLIVVLVVGNLLWCLPDSREQSEK